MCMVLLCFVLLWSHCQLSLLYTYGPLPISFWVTSLARGQSYCNPIVSEDFFEGLTHHGLVMPYGEKDMGQHWFQ